jgi:CheY-like chemotaxis protein
MKGIHILVVEDEQIVAEDLKMTLEVLGYQVIGIVRSGEKAVEIATTENPDLILMDIMLEGEMDGISAASQIRADRDIPVIYVTAYADSTLLERAKQTEPYGYIVKPFNEREVQSNIEIALFKHRMEHEIKKRDAILLALGFGMEWFLRQFSASHLITPKEARDTKEYDFFPLLEQLGISMDLDRVQVFKLMTGDDKPKSLKLVSEWTMEGMLPFIDAERNQVEAAPWIGQYGSVKELRAGNPTIINRKDISGKEREMMEKLDIYSAIVFPVFVQDCIWGAVIFSSSEERELLVEETEAMKIAVNIISGAVGLYESAGSVQPDK